MKNRRATVHEWVASNMEADAKLNLDPAVQGEITAALMPFEYSKEDASTRAAVDALIEPFKDGSFDPALLDGYAAAPMEKLMKVEEGAQNLEREFLKKIAAANTALQQLSPTLESSAWESFSGTFSRKAKAKKTQRLTEAFKAYADICTNHAAETKETIEKMKKIQPEFIEPLNDLRIHLGAIKEIERLFLAKNMPANKDACMKVAVCHAVVQNGYSTAAALAMNITGQLRGMQKHLDLLEAEVEPVKLPPPSPSS